VSAGCGQSLYAMSVVLDRDTILGGLDKLSKVRLCTFSVFLLLTNLIGCQVTAGQGKGDQRSVNPVCWVLFLCKQSVVAVRAHTAEPLRCRVGVIKASLGLDRDTILGVLDKLSKVRLCPTRPGWFEGW
jgi:hypothetical protein